jgi:DNA-binding NtrC family response regulator
LHKEKKYSVLLVDDDPSFRKQMDFAFGRAYDIVFAGSEAMMWEKFEVGYQFDLVLLDLKLDDTQENVGLKIIPKLKERYPEVPVIVVTGEKDGEAIIEAMEAGAKTYLQKGKYDKEKWHQKFQDAINTRQAKVLEKQVETLEEKVEVLEETVEVLVDKIEEVDKYQFVGVSPQVAKIKTTLIKVSQQPKITVLITGETGTGKEVAARFLHQHGARANKPFVGLNLSAIPASMLEAQLFGYKKGAFTDAKTDFDGFFVQANGGILMLDEIGDINPDIQVKLLRFLDNPVITPLGTTKEIPLDVQIVTATRKNLPEEIQAGRFREDLYFRLKRVQIEMPPLLLDHFLQLSLPGANYHTLLAPEVRDHLLRYHWPGNIRELRNTIDHLLLQQDIEGLDVIDMSLMPPEMVQPSAHTGSATPVSGGNDHAYHAPAAANTPAKSRKEEIALLDLIKIEDALRQTNGDKGEATQLLGYEKNDLLRSRIETCYKNYPHLFGRFPLIQKCYHLSLKKVDASRH